MKKGIIAGAGGGGSKGGSSRTPIEAVDNVESKSLAFILDLLGEGVIGGLKEGGKSVFLDDVPLLNPDGTPNFSGVKIWERKGQQNQDPIEGFDDIETPKAVAVEVKASTPKTIQIDNDETDRVRIIMDFPRLSSTDKESGDINGTSVEFQFQLAVGDGSFKPVKPVDYKSDIIKVSKKSSGKFQKEYFIDLPKPGKNYRIKVIRLTADSNSDYLVNKTILGSYGEIIFAKMTYPNSALVGISIDSKEFGNNMPRRSYLVSGMLIRVPSNYDPIDNTYSGDWDGSFDYRVSSNPAWILYDILISDRYGLGKYVKEHMVDVGMLYQIGRYCDEEVSDGFGGKEKRFAINTVISSRQEAFKVINDIASVFRGMVFWAGGMINMRQDKPSDPVMLFSSANIMGRVTRKGSARKDRPTVAVVTYNDKDDLYKQNIEYVEDQDAIKDRGVVKTELLAFGCTSRGQAHRTGLWLLYTAKMETDVILFKAGIDCSALMPGDVVKLNDKYRSGKRNSGRIVSFTKNSIKLDQSVNLSNSGAFISFMSKEGKLIDRDVLEAAGERSVLTFKEPLKAHEEPVNLAVWMVTEPDLEPELVRVVSIKDTDEKGVFEITGVSHNPSKYQAIDNGATLIPSKTTVKDPTFVTPSNIEINETTYLSSPGNLSNKLIVSWQGRSTQYTIRYRRSDVVDNWAVVEVFDTQYEILNVQQDAKYDVEVFAISITGRKTNAIASTYAVLGKSNPPDAPKQLVAVGDYRQNVLTWIAPAAIDLEKINVYGSKTNKFETASLLASVPSTTFNHSGLEDNVTWFYWVRAVNKRGMLSPVNSNIGTQATTKEVMSFLKDKITETELSKDLLADINENAANLAAEKVNEDVKIQVDEVKKNVAESKDMANKAISDITKLSTSVDKEIADRKESVTALTNSTNSLSEKLTQEIKNRNDSVAAESQKRADDLVAESKSRVADIKKETDARLLGLQNEAKARSNALKEETRLRNEAIQTKSAELSKEILNEKVERGAAISASERKIQTTTDALAMRITNLSTATDANAAAIKKEEQTRTTADKAEAKERQSLATQMRGDYDGTDVTKITSGLIFSEREARTTADKAEALQRRSLETRLGESLTAVNKSVESISTAQKAQGNDITAINTTLKNKADSSAVNSLNSKVEEQGKTLTSQGSAVTKLQNDLGVANTSIGKKADSSALSALESKVVQQGKDIVSQGSLVNSLQNNLNTTNSNVNKKADSSTVSTLDSKVTQQGKDIASQGGLLNTLQNRINTTDSNVSKKADSSAVTALESKVTQQGKDISSHGNSITELKNSTSAIKNDLDDVNLLARITTNGKQLVSNPNFNGGSNDVVVYNNANNGMALIATTKRQVDNPTSSSHEIVLTAKGTASPNFGGFIRNVQSKANAVFVTKYIIKLPVGWGLQAHANATGDGRIDKFVGNNTGTGKYETYYRITKCGSTGKFETFGHVSVYIADGGKTKAPTSAAPLVWYLAQIEVYETTDYASATPEVTNFMSSAKSSLDSLTNTTKSQSSQLTALQNSLNTTNSNVGKKADSSALSALDSKVTQQGKDITATNSSVTSLQSSLNGRITFVITSGGTGSGYSGRVFDNNGKVLASIGRSYGVVVFKKNTKGMVDVASSKTYDVYGNAANATTLVNDIKALPYGTYVAITTSDEPNQNRLSILAAIELLGGTKETFTSFPHRGAYILVGRIGARGGDSIELASRSGNDSNAFVETSIEFVNGVLMNYGNSSGAASLASANASAISKLDNTVKQQGGNITSHSSQLTKLQNDLNITNNNVGKKADATALSALESKVTQQGKDISSVSSKATSLENSLKTTNDNVGKKADTTALNSLTSKVNTVEGKVNAATSSITTLSSKIDQVKSDLTDLIEVDLDLSKLDQNTYYPVTLHLNTLTRYYFKVFRTLGQFPTNNPSYATHGTKTFSTILEWNVSGDGWGTQAQNRIIQNFDFRFTNQSPVLTPGQLSNSSIEYVYLRGGSFYKLTKPKNCGHTIRTAAYTSNSQTVAPIAYNASLIPVSFGKGTSDAISNLSTKVTSIDGKLNTTASDVTNLKTTVGKKADSTALNSLTSTVTQHGKDISAHSSSLSQLTTKVNGNTTKIDQVSKSVSDVSKAQTETKNSMESQFKGQSAKIETLEKTVASGAGLSSTWMVKMAANTKGQKYAAGIALGIEGKNLQSQFLVQADRFALINTANGTTTTPFVIDGGVTYISAASIKNGSIDSAKFGDLQSNNYKANSTGWKLGKNGTLEMNGQTSGKGRLSITNNRIDVYDEKGVLRVRLGLL
ncbi:phage tail tip fiber protein [Providencia manganoxydans]|uniref:phage tail tip fiber protein n=1 Tax=Providencia manganoxydans TaxID=2923283 RepID=UPI0034E39732